MAEATAYGGHADYYRSVFANNTLSTLGNHFVGSHTAPYSLGEPTKVDTMLYFLMSPDTMDAMEANTLELNSDLLRYRSASEYEPGQYRMKMDLEILADRVQPEQMREYMDMVRQIQADTSYSMKLPVPDFPAAERYTEVLMKRLEALSAGGGAPDDSGKAPQCPFTVAADTSRTRCFS